MHAGRCGEYAARRASWVRRSSDGSSPSMEDPTESDWRLHGQKRYLADAHLTWRHYRRYEKNPEWDHDHCEFRWATFAVEDLPDVLHEGYCTPDDYRWICKTCFEDFRVRFRWTLVPSQVNG